MMVGCEDSIRLRILYVPQRDCKTGELRIYLLDLVGKDTKASKYNEIQVRI